MEELLAILSEIRPDVDFEIEDQLITGRVLDSFDIMAIVAALDDKYDIRIKPAELTPEQFNSAEAIYDLVNKLMDED